MRIVSIKDKRLKALVEAPDRAAVKGFSPREASRLGQMIVAIQAMTYPGQLAALSSWRAHELKGVRAGTWSLTVTPNYRLTFVVDLEAQTAALLDYEDYH